eukprot:3336968-Pleurochrysis_carterae.AAC.8
MWHDVRTGFEHSQNSSQSLHMTGGNRACVQTSLCVTPDRSVRGAPASSRSQQSLSEQWRQAAVPDRASSAIPGERGSRSLLQSQCTPVPGIRAAQVDT